MKIGQMLRPEEIKKFQSVVRIIATQDKEHDRRIVREYRAAQKLNAYKIKMAQRRRELQAVGFNPPSDIKIYSGR